MCGLWIFAVNWVDSQIWIKDQLWILVHNLDCACLGFQIFGPKWNLDHRSFFSPGQYVNELIQIICFLNEAHSKSVVRLLLELYCVIVIKYVSFFTICMKLTMAFTFTTLPLNFALLFLDVFVVSDLKEYWWIDGFGYKSHRLRDLNTLIDPPSFRQARGGITYWHRLLLPHKAPLSSFLQISPWWTLTETTGSQ